MKRGLKADAADNVGVVLETVRKGETVSFDACAVTAQEEIHMPHKMALVFIKEGDAVRKFGGTIGFATQDIQPGEWVHSHNVASCARKEE